MPIVASNANVVLALKDNSFKTMSYEMDNKLFYGVELEVEVPYTLVNKAGSRITNWQTAEIAEKALNGFAIMKSECSIHNGFEIVTAPLTLDVHRCLIWDEVFKKCDGMIKGSRNTGMHVHFSRDGLSVKQLAKVIYFIHETANSNFLSKIAGRRVYSAASWCVQRKKNIDIYGNPALDSSAQRLINDEYGTRTAISVSQRFHGKSVEVRIFQSVPAKSAVISALEFLDSLIKYTDGCSNTEKALSYGAYVDWFETKGMKKLYPTYNDNLLQLGIIEPPLRGVACLYPRSKKKTA